MKLLQHLANSLIQRLYHPAVSEVYNAMRPRTGHPRRRHAMNPLQLAVESLEPRLLMSTLYWLGGSGNWNDTNWNTESDGSGCTVAWSDGDDAVFENSAAISVTLSSANDANSITFGEDAGVTLTGGSLGLGGSPQITVNDAPATINSVITGSSGLSIYRAGDGTLTLTGANTYTGTTDIYGGGTTQFTGSALAALPNVGTTLEMAQLTINGTVSWSDTDVTGTAAQITISGNVTLSGGTWDLDSDSEITVESGGTLSINGGDVATGALFNSGTVNLTAGSLTLNNVSSNGYSDGALDWTGGDLAIDGDFQNAGTMTVETGAHTLSGTGDLRNDGTLTWSGGDLDASILQILNEEGTFTLDGGGSTLTLGGTVLTNGDSYNPDAAITWSSGTIAATDSGSIVNDDYDSATFAVGSEAEVTLDASAGSLSGTITNEGVLHWTGTDTTYLPNIANTGTVVFDDAVNLVGLTGSSSATEGSTYTLTIGSVSGDIPDTITDYYVDWGDGIGFDGPTPIATTSATYTYGGSESSSTDYTIEVHLVGAGTWVYAANKTITVADVAPVVTLDDPGTTSTTPTLTGTAGISPGDASTVTINIYEGSDTTGTLAFTDSADVDPDTGLFSYTLADADALPAGTYTYQATQTETAGITGFGASRTFTVALQVPSVVTGLTPTVISAHEIDLTWDAAPTADYVTSFSIYQSTDYGVTFTFYNSAATTTISVDSLFANTPYVFEVVANNAMGSAPATASSITWTASGIATPTGLTATAQGFDGIHLAWTDNSTDELAYQVEAKWSIGGQFVVIANDLAAHSGTGAMSYQVTDWPTQAVTFRVRAVANALSAYSDDASCAADTSFMNQGTVTDIYQDGYDADGAVLHWNQETAGGYTVVYRKLAANPGSYAGWGFNILGGVAGAGEAQADLPWDFLAWPEGAQVAVYTTGDDGPSVTDIVNVFPPTTLAAPTLSVVVDYVNSTYDLTYDAVPDGVTYRLFNVGSPEGGIGSYICDLTGDFTALPFSDFPGLAKLRDSNFAILAFDSTGDAGLSNVVDAAFARDPGVQWLGFGHNDVLTAAPAPTGAITLAWDNNSYNEDGFQIQWSATGGDDDSDWTTLTTTAADQSSYVDNTAPNGALRYYRIRAVRTQTIDEDILVDGEATGATAALDSAWVYSPSVKLPYFELQILWEGSTITESDGTVISNDEPISGLNIDFLFTGQKISLKARLLVDGSEAATGPVQWNLGSLGDVVKGYKVTASTGAVVPVVAGDLTQKELALYCVVDAPDEEFSVSSDGYSALTDFVIKKPGHSIYNTPGQDFSVTATQNPVEILSVSGTEVLGDDISWTADIPVGAVGTTFWLQLVNLQLVRTSWWTGVRYTGADTKGESQLDNFYPYPYDGDFPNADLLGWVQGTTYSFYATDWLMWQPPGADSIPVPIQTWSWNWFGDAEWNWPPATGDWGLASSSPESGGTITGTYTDTYATWTHVYYNG